MKNRRNALISIILVTIMLGGLIPQQFLPDLIKPKETTTTTTETFTFDETVYHTSRKNIMDEHVFFETEAFSSYNPDSAWCGIIQNYWSEWDCTDLDNQAYDWCVDGFWAGSNGCYLEWEEYSASIYVEYDYKIRHTGSAEIQFSTTQNGNSAPSTTATVQSSTESFDTDVKASIKVDLKRTFTKTGQVRNTETITDLPFPIYGHDLDGSGNSVMIGNQRIWLWDEYVPLASTSSPTGVHNSVNGLGSVKALDGAVTVARVDLLELGADYFQGTQLGAALSAFNYFLRLDFDLDLDMDLDVQSVVQPFTSGTATTYSLSQTYGNSAAANSYGCHLGFIDSLAQSPAVASSCTKILSSENDGSANVILGTGYTFKSQESYSTQIRLRPQSNTFASIAWNLFTNEPYIEWPISSGMYASTSTSQTSSMTSSSAILQVPQPQSAPAPNSEPIAVLSVTPTVTTVGNTVVANTLQSNDADNDPLSVHVSWGDGSSSTGWVSPGQHQHQYDSPGTYTITAMAYDGADISPSTTRMVTIQEISSNVAAQLTLNRSTIDEGDSVTFSFGASGASSLLNFYLDFGDGTNHSSFFPGQISHTFSDDGVFYPQLYVYTSDYSVYETDSVQVTVERVLDNFESNTNNFRITGDKILVVIDEDNQSLMGNEDRIYYPGNMNSNASEVVLFESLNTVSQIAGYDWDIYIVGDTDGDNIWDTSNQSGPELGLLADYRLVIWSSGGSLNPFTETDESNIETYVDVGGRLVLFAQDYLYGACWSCEEWDEDTFANATLGVSRSWQDSGSNDMYANSGEGIYNLGYLPLAGLDDIQTRNVAWGTNGMNVSWQDSIFISEDSENTLGVINSTLDNGTEVSHGIVKMHDTGESSIGVRTRTAFFAFDLSQLTYRYDSETMMLGIFNWALDDWNDKSNISNAAFVAVGTEAATTIGPEYGGGHAASLIDWHKVHIPAGRTYDLAFAPAWSWNGSTSGCQVLLNSVGIYDDSGTNLIQSFSCDSTTSEWSLSFTPTETAIYAIRVQIYDYYSDDEWGYWYHVNVTDAGDSSTSSDCYQSPFSNPNPLLVADGPALSDVVNPYIGSYSAEEYASSCFDLDVVAGVPYAVTLIRSEISESGIQIWVSNSSTVSGQTSDVASGLETKAEVAFVSNQTGTVSIATYAFDYIHPLLAKGSYTIRAWTLPTTQPIDDYLNATNASPVNTTIDGWVDAVFDDTDWWTIPVAPEEPLSVDFTVDREGTYRIYVYWTPENDPYDYYYLANISSMGNASIDLESLPDGDLRIAMFASWGRTNYSIDIRETDSSPQMTLGELHIAEVGIVDSTDTWELDLSAGTPLVIRGNATSAWTQNSVSTLSYTLTTPSGSVINSTYSQLSTNLTLSHLTQEDGTYTVSVSGSSGYYWLWPFFDDGLEIDSNPQRYATAEVEFSDTVVANQSVISERYAGSWLGTWQSYSLDQAPAGMVINASSGEIQFTPTRQQVGNHVVSVQVSNDYGASIWQNFTFVVSELPNAAPVLTDLGSLTSSLGSQMNIQLQAFDADNDSLIFSIINGPAGSIINSASGLISWTPTSMGAQSFDVMVEDEHGLSHNLSFVVMATNDAPIPASLSAQQIGVGQAYTDALSATDSEGHSTMWGMRSGPIGFTIATSGLASWTPAANQVGIHTVIAEVADSYGETSVMWWTIEVMNTAPTVTSIDDASLYPGQLLDINLSMMDNDGHDLWATLISGPSGLSIDDNGHILWIPYANQIGEHDVEILVVDSFGSTSTISFTVDVLNSNPTLVELRTWQDLRHATIWVLFEAADVDGHATSFTCVSQELVTTRVGENNHLIEWDPTSTEDSLSTTCSAVDGHGGLVSLQVDLAFTVPDLSLEVISEDTFAYEVPITAILQSGINLTSVEVESLAGGSADVSEDQDGIWDLTYTPADNESGPITVLISATTDVGDELQTVWSFNRESEDLSWACSVSQIAETEDDVVGIWTECSRSDIVIATETMSGQVDESSTPLSWTGLGYGDYSLVMIFTGPDGKTTTEMVTWNNPHPVANGQIDDISINATLGEVMTLQLAWSSENTSAPYCRDTADRAEIVVSADCVITLTPNMTGRDMFIIELFEGDVKLDGATITVQVYEPEAIVDEEKGMLSTLILPGVGGLVLGLLIFGATLQIIRMRSAGKEGQESFSSTLKDSTPTPLQPMTMAAPPPPSSAISAVQSPIIDDDKCQVDENGIKWFNDDDGIWWYKSPDMVDWMKR